MGQASPCKAKGLSMGAVPHSLPGSGLMGREDVGHPPAVLPTSRPCPKVPGGVKPTAASRAGPHLGSEPLPAPGRPSGPSSLRSGCTPVVPGTTQTERAPAVLRKWVPGDSGHRPCGATSCDTAGWPQSPAHRPSLRRAGLRLLVSTGGGGPHPPPSPAGPSGCTLGRAPVAPRDPAAPSPWGSLAQLVLGQPCFPRPPGHASGQP